MSVEPDALSIVRAALAEVGYSPDAAWREGDDIVIDDAVVPLDVQWRAFTLLDHAYGEVDSCRACYRVMPNECARRRSTCTADRLGVLDCGADRG